MNCGVCILPLHACRRGGGGESEDNVTEMTSSGSGSRYLLRQGGGEDSGGEGRKRGVFDARRGGTSDEERRVPACSGWFCHEAYCMRTCRKGIVKHTPIRDLHHGSNLHASRRHGRPDSVMPRMYACT